MSVAYGMWYQSESKLKMPRSSASLVVRPQCAKTKPTTPTVTTHGSQDQAPGPAGGAVGGPAPEDALATGRGGGSPAVTGPAGWSRQSLATTARTPPAITR